MKTWGVAYLMLYKCKNELWAITKKVLHDVQHASSDRMRPKYDAHGWTFRFLLR
jgi:hypothetical protein